MKNGALSPPPQQAVAAALPAPPSPSDFFFAFGESAPANFWNPYGSKGGRRLALGENKSRVGIYSRISCFGISCNRIYTDFVDKGVYQKDYQEIIARLTKARIEAGFTQSEIAKKLKKPQSYVSKIESGERRLDVAEIKKFAEIYKKPINYFI